VGGSRYGVRTRCVQISIELHTLAAHALQLGGGRRWQWAGRALPPHSLIRRRATAVAADLLRGHFLCSSLHFRQRSLPIATKSGVRGKRERGRGRGRERESASFGCECERNVLELCHIFTHMRYNNVTILGGSGFSPLISDSSWLCSGCVLIWDGPLSPR